MNFQTINNVIENKELFEYMITPLLLALTVYVFAVILVNIFKVSTSRIRDVEEDTTSQSEEGTPYGDYEDMKHIENLYKDM